MVEPTISITESPFEFYTRYYQAIAASPADSTYCKHLFGCDMGQHGFAEISHLDHLGKICELGPGIQALDLGCGDGRIAEYLSDSTGVKITGIDWIPQAIQQARARTEDKQDRLTFQAMDMDDLRFTPASFDVIYAIDTLYFTQLAPALYRILPLLRHGGRLAAFFSQGAPMGMPLDQFDRSTIQPDRTELADAFNKLELIYMTWDYSHADYEHAQRKQFIAESLQAEFAAEGNLFLFENHLAEAIGVQTAYKAGAHARYLYLITL